MSTTRLNRVVWFGVLAGPASWATQFLFAMQLGLARCESPDRRFQFPVHTTSAALGAAGVAIGLLAEVAAIAVFRATHPDRHTHDREDITVGRLHFLATVGMTVNPLTTTICLMVAIGVPLLGICHQS